MVTNLFNVTIFAKYTPKKSFWNWRPKTIIHKLTETVVEASDSNEAKEKADKMAANYISVDPEFFSKLELVTFALRVK